MAFFLGIDGGGSGCRAVIADAGGRVLGTGTAGPANINTDPDGARGSILEAAGAAMAGAGVRPAEVRAALGLAGANVEGAAARIAHGLGFARVRVVTDAVIAALGALGDDDGIVAVMGTGSVFTRTAGGVTRQFGGRGFVLGDEGSGAVLGRALLGAALRAADGFCPMTPLLAAVIDELGGEQGVIAFATAARPAGFAAYAPRIVDSADPAARRLLVAAVAEVAAIIDTLQAGAGLPVVFLGGLGPAYRAALDGRWQVRAPRGTALDGALALARREG